MKNIPLLLLCTLGMWTQLVGQMANRQALLAELSPAGLLVQTTDGQLLLTPHGAHSMAVEYVPNGHPNPPSYALTDGLPDAALAALREEQEAWWYTTPGLAVRIQKNPLQLSYTYGGQPLLQEAEGYFERGDSLLGFRFALAPAEKLMGGGSRVLGMDRRGRRLRLYNQPSYGYTTLAEQMYYSLPVVISSRRYMLVFDNGADGYADLGATEPNVLEFSAFGGRRSYLLVAADTWPELATHFTALTGRQPLPPRWALGNIASRMGYHSQREVEAVVDQYRADDIPLDGIVLDLFWFGPDVKGHLGNFDWWRDSFPQPLEMLDRNRDKGVQTVLITEPFVLTGSRTYQEVVERGLVGTTTGGQPYIYDFFFGRTTLLDIFKPTAQAWFWEQVYRPHTHSGVGGWWGDLGEPEHHPHDLRHVNGTAREVHNLYGHTWAKTLYEGYARDFPTQRPVILMRAGFVGSQRYGMLPWSGDVSRSWGGLQSQVEISLQMGMQGLAYMHSDLGGFAGDLRDAELYLRWLQYGVFQPVYRTHAQEAVPAEPIFWDAATKAVARQHIKRRYQLLPYLYTLAYENAVTGLPLMRPLFYVDDRPELLTYTDAYLWGPDLLVAPVLRPGVTSQTLYLPRGRHWIDWRTGQDYAGGQEITLPVDPTDIPVLVGAGAFIPMMPPVASTTQHDPSRLEVHYYHHPTVRHSSGQVYEDDGHSPGALAQRAYSLLKFEANQTTEGLTLAVRQAGFSYPGQPAVQNIQLVVHYLPGPPTSLEALPYADGSRPALTSYWDAQRRCLVINLQVARQEVRLTLR